MQRWTDEARVPDGEADGEAADASSRRTGRRPRPAADRPPIDHGAEHDGEHTAAVPSLNRLSASTIVVSRDETPRRRNRATTLTGSVAAMSAPNSRATRPARGRRARCTPAAGEGEGDQHAGHARARAMRRQSREQVPRLEVEARLEQQDGQEDVEDEVGREPERASTCVTRPRTSPTSTSPMVYGTPTRRATTATAAAMMSRRTSASSTSRPSTRRVRRGSWPSPRRRCALEAADAGHGVLERRPGRVVVHGEHHVAEPGVAGAP